MDINLPREKETGKTRGFGFLMYEDQRSTILAVDNLNGAKILDRTLRVDHVKNYKQQKVKGEDGEMVEREEQSLNAKPEMVVGAYSGFMVFLAWIVDVNFSGGLLSSWIDEDESEESVSSGPEIDPEDPMASYLLQKRKEEKERERKKGGKKGKFSKDKHKDETPEERRERKERKRAKKALKKSSKKVSGLRGVEEMLERMNAGASRDDVKWAREREGRERSRSPRRGYSESGSAEPRDRERGWRESQAHRDRSSRSPVDHDREREERRDARYSRTSEGSRERERGRYGHERDYRRSTDAREARRRDVRRDSRSKSPA